MNECDELGAEACVFGDIDLEAHRVWCTDRCDYAGIEAIFPLWQESREGLTFCRYFKNKGLKVAPFKALNISLNSYVTKDGLEMGRAQVVQAEACEIGPEAWMNPV